jgi:ubiquinone/menaquinone biosynthesis C-methylase UbiE
MSNKIEARGALTNRGLKRYNHDFSTTDNYFNNPKEIIVDWGTGRSGDFFRDCKKKGLKAYIINTDPRYALSIKEDISDLYGIEKLERMKFRKNMPASSVGVGYNSLPFRSGSIDKILANHSFPYYAKPKELFAGFTEAYRVLKVGGEFRYYPCTKEDYDGNYKWFAEKFPNFKQEFVLPEDANITGCVKLTKIA